MSNETSAVSLPEADRDIRIFEDAIPSTLFDRMSCAVRDIGDERLKGGYKTTFWFPRGLKPTNLAEEVATALVRLAQPPDDWIGVEWWLGRLRRGQKLSLHFDRDLVLSRKFGRIEHPLLGSILYLNEFPSSPTVILGQVSGSEPGMRVPRKPLFRRSVQAVPNRYIVFRGDLRHGVVPEEGGDGDHRADTPPSRSDELRSCLLVNYWHRRPMPPICRDYDGSVYGRLRDAGRRSPA